MLLTMSSTYKPSRTDRRERLLDKVPYGFGCLLTLGLPVGLILCVTALVYGIMLPISYVLGWL